ncbi:MAG TPA: ABC transporter permease [Tepidisphaeraceae bacterium]|nr:ABC transporter permease [Tepidisphaeraceae bacterium]
MTTQSDIPAVDHLWRRMLANRRVLFGGIMLLVVVGLCVATVPWTLFHSESRYHFDYQDDMLPAIAPGWQVHSDPLDQTSPLVDSRAYIFGTDKLGRSILGRCLMGGTISLAVGIAAAMISVLLGVTVGMLAGYRGGWVDALLMRFVDIMYGLPYVLLVILFKIAFEPFLERALGTKASANIVTMFVAIGLVSWLTMARVVRGQVLSIRSQPYIEACRAMGLPQTRIFLRHILPNLVGVVIVYATLTVPVAILQESFLSFLGIGVAAPMPSWGSLAAEGVSQAFQPYRSSWWMLAFPCIFLGVTLLCLNFVGDGLRDIFDPKREAAKI